MITQALLAMVIVVCVVCYLSLRQLINDATLED
jgi:hypothetical protein